jgi:hypothetical protein
MAIKIVSRPFGRGMNQTTDDRLLEPGVPRSMENLVVLKNGRVAMRLDYDALPSTMHFGSSLQLFDLFNLGDRLFGIGTYSDTANNGVIPTKGSDQVFEFINTAAFGWAQLSQNFLSIVQHVRNVGQIPLQPSSVVNADIAVGSGVVCCAWQAQVSGVNQVVVAIFNAATGSCIDGTFFAGASLPRVVFLGGIFWISFTDTTNGVFIKTFNVALGTFSAISDPDGASVNAVVALDMSLDHELTSFWLAFGRVGATTRYYKYNSVGTQLVNQAGPAVLVNAISVFAEAQTGAQQRMHLALTLNATNRCRVDTILIPSLVTETSTADQFGVNVVSQVGMCVVVSNPSHIACIGQTVASTLSGFQGGFVSNTHAADPQSSVAAVIASKLLSMRDRILFATLEAEGAAASSNMLRQRETYISSVTMPAAIVDRLFAAQPNLSQLPNLAFDSSTSKGYWMRLANQSGAVASPIATEFDVNSTARRSTVVMGNIAYLSAGVVQAVDGNCAAEAGGFAVRPVISSIIGAAGGSLTLLATYQVVAVLEVFDSRNNRVQSAPSEVFSVTLTGANNALIVGHNVGGIGKATTFWLGLTRAGRPGLLAGTARMVYYRTLPTNAGNLTFFRDPSTSNTLIASDTTLQAQEVLYTQGARGSLSGPLSFVTPQPATSLTASADRITSAGLPDRSTLQESRPQFPGEQLNWSDSIAFLREVRGDILAVVRLDERRLAFTATEIFELDGEGVDDNGNGDIGAGRRLPSDVGLFGGVLGWRSLVEFPGGVMFQGSQTLLYLLPRGGVAPIPKGLEIQDKVAAFPTITAAVYSATDKIIRFCCNNVGLTDSILLLYDVIHDAWSFEGPFGVPTASAARFQDRIVLLQNNVVKQQRASHPPAALIANAWRGALEHPFGPGGWGQLHELQYFGEYQGDCLIRPIVTFDDATVEALAPFEVYALERSFADASALATASRFGVGTIDLPTRAAGDVVTFSRKANQLKCESFRVDWQVEQPFPVPIGFTFNNTAGVKTNSIATALPTPTGGRQVGDRVIIGIVISGGTASVGPPSLGAAPVGFTLRASGFTLGGLSAIYERILTGTDTLPTITWTGNPFGACTVAVLLRNSHPSAFSEVGISVANTAGSLSLAPFSPTPSWGAKNTRWLTFLMNDVRTASGNVTIVPDPLKRIVQQNNTSSDPDLNGQLTYGDFALNAANVSSVLTPAFGWIQPGPGQCFTVAVRPSDTLPSAGLIHNYFAYSSEAAEGMSRKGPLQIG